MKLKNTPLLVAVALTSSLSVAEVEIDLSGQLIFEASKFLENDDGKVQDNQTFQAHGKDWFKNSVDLRVYVDGDIDDIIENATFHVELNGFVNPLGSGADNGNNYNEAYTQRDILREAYIDTQYGEDWAIRAGKQQIVWGTADGMKLLDMMNPTDYTEMAQNQMEDSRIPVWMVSAETVLENDTDLTVVISEPRENQFAGLNRSIDTSVRGNGAHVTNWNGTGVPIGYKDTPGVSHDDGQFTLMRGPTSITGAYDGFTNIIPDMGSIAALFGESFSNTDNGVPTYKLGGLSSDDFKGFKVEEFLSGDSDAIHSNFGAFSDRMRINSVDNTNGFGDMNFAKYVDNMYGSGSWDAAQVAADAVRTTTLVANANATEDDIQDAIQLAVDAGDIGAQYTIEGDVALSSFFTSKFASNLFDTRDGGADFSQGINTDSAFEYMGNTTFKTFDAFVNAKNQYSFKNMPSSDQVDFAIRNAGKAENGMNWQVAYAYGFDRNPIIEMNWKSTNGEALTVNYEDGDGTTYTKDSSGNWEGDACPVDDCTLSLTDDDGNEYGGAAQDIAVSTLGANATDAEIQTAIDSKSAILEFAQETTRIHSLGGAFDMAIETGDTLGTMVLRGEGIYQKGVHQPTVHFDKLGYGDLASSLEMREIDRFKFVIGFDFTFLTNMFSSLQIIRDINLDSMYCAPGSVKVSCDADFATMMLSNGFNTDGAVKFKEYYSLYFSKPFGESGQHRWNNMTMYEGGDGWWNWFTIGFGMTDDIEATFELNHYWGNPNTAFGQHQKSNNVQVGLKYNF